MRWIVQNLNTEDVTTVRQARRLKCRKWRRGRPTHCGSGGGVHQNHSGQRRLLVLAKIMNSPITLLVGLMLMTFVIIGVLGGGFS